MRTDRTYSSKQPRSIENVYTYIYKYMPMCIQIHTYIQKPLKAATRPIRYVQICIFQFIYMYTHTYTYAQAHTNVHTLTSH